MARYNDSTGKHKVADARSRSAVLSTVFVLGVTLGIVLSEKLYIRTQEGSIPVEVLKTLHLQRLGSNTTKEVVAVASGDKQADTAVEPHYVKGGEPRNELEKILQSVAPDGEVMIVISNMNLVRESSLELWLQCASKIKSKNWLVVAIDEELRDYCKEKGINHYYRPVIIPDTQKRTGDNHAISAMKYEIVEEFLSLGWNVLLSDVDIVIVQDPFENLHRDHDVEGMSDGFDGKTAYGEIYGVDDATMGWSRYAQGVKHMVLNSGLFYLRSNSRTVELMKRISERLHKQAGWDQSIYNEEIFFLSHGEYRSSRVTVRVMDHEIFMNSKTLFKFVRHLPASAQKRPVMVHMNYHPDKSNRMRAVIKHYLEGDAEALKEFPGGSEPGS